MKYSIEPCHPLGFWSRSMEGKVADGDFSSPHATVRFLELNTLAQLEDSIDQGARTAATLLQHDEPTVAFLLDDLFASEELMTLMPPERVAEMITSIWSSRAAGTSLPTTCTVVSERSLTATALALVGDEDNGKRDAPIVARHYQGIQIEVPAQARTYIGDSAPSCPLLAAAWQMWRLGRLSDCVDQITCWGDQPKDAERTFTILNTSLMPVEVAVGVILDVYDAEAREYMGYLFQPDHW